MMILKVVILSLLCNYCDADHCTDSCDQQFPGGLNVTMCGTDMETHLTHSDAFYDNTCYDLCGIMTYYEGVCGCPHNCYNEFNQGTCMMMDNAKCQCAAGWGGDDCSLPLTGNSCSLHGSIVSTTDKDSVFPFDYCLCDRGFTGSDCSSSELTLTNHPWGNIFDVKTYYDDKYEDEHPVWNISVIATVRVEIAVEDYMYLLNPENLYTEDYTLTMDTFKNQLPMLDFV